MCFCVSLSRVKKFNLEKLRLKNCCLPSNTDEEEHTIKIDVTQRKLPFCCCCFLVSPSISFCIKLNERKKLLHDSDLPCEVCFFHFTLSLCSGSFDLLPFSYIVSIMLIDFQGFPNKVEHKQN